MWQDQHPEQIIFLVEVHKCHLRICPILVEQAVHRLATQTAVVLEAEQINVLR